MAKHGAHIKKVSKATKVVIIVAAFVLVACLIPLGYIGWGYYNGASTYDKLQSYTSFDEKTEDLSVDWSGLAQINSDIAGWMYMPGTDISYPICWRQGDDDYYLDHDFNGNQSSGIEPTFGTIYLSGSNTSDFSDESNFIFGHNMLITGKMFSPFSDNQGNNDWFNEHRTIYLLTPNGNFELETFAQIKVDGAEDGIVCTSFATTQEFKDYVEKVNSSSIVTPNDWVDLNSIDKIFAFSTCSKPDTDNRIITFARVATTS